MAVEESNLTVQISALRRAVDQGRVRGSCIQTIPGRSYRFVASVTRGEPSFTSPAVQLLDDMGGEASSQSGRSQEATRRAHPAMRGRARRFPWRLGSIIGAAILSLGLVVAAAWIWRSPQRSQAGSPPPLSIVVLPFASLSADEGQRYFADAITEDLTTDLSRLANALVISASTARTYEGKPADVKRIGRELGVKYVLEGSIERSNDRVRINAQLIDAEADAHLWADRFDRSADDLFALEDERKGASPGRSMSSGPRRGGATNRARRRIERYFSRPRALVVAAIARELRRGCERFRTRAGDRSAFSRAQSFLAISLNSCVLAGMSGSRTADLARAAELVGRALSVAPGSGFAHFAKGQLLRVQHRCDAAIPEYEAMIAANRNSAAAIARVGYCELRVGLPEETTSLIERAIRLSPRDPQLGVWYLWLGQAYLLQSRIGDAVAWLEKARSAEPGLWFVHEWLAAATLCMGRGGSPPNSPNPAV